MKVESGLWCNTHSQYVQWLTASMCAYAASLAEPDRCDLDEVRVFRPDDCLTAQWCDAHEAMDVGLHVPEGMCELASRVPKVTPCRMVSIALVPVEGEEK